MAGTRQKGRTCSQLSLPSAVNEAKQKKASRQRQRGCMKKVGSKRVDRLFFKTKVSNYSHWLRGRRGKTFLYKPRGGPLAHDFLGMSLSQNDNWIPSFHMPLRFTESQQSTKLYLNDL